MAKNQTKSKESTGAGAGRGGARNGSGRPPGSATKRTREIADKAMKAGITPLEVMLEAMTKLRSKGELEKAAGVAKDAAPYMHPRLASVEHTGPNGGPVQIMATPADERI